MLPDDPSFGDDVQVDYPGYRSTRLRAPKRPLVTLPEELHSLDGPVFGDETVSELDHDLTRQHEGEPLGERIIVSRPRARRGRAGRFETPWSRCGRRMQPAATPPGRPASGAARPQLLGRRPLSHRRRRQLPLRHGEARRLPVGQPRERLASRPHPLLGLRPRLHAAARHADVLPGRPALPVRPDLQLGARPEGARRSSCRSSISRRRSPTGRSRFAGTSCSATAAAARRRSRKATHEPPDARRRRRSVPTTRSGSAVASRTSSSPLNDPAAIRVIGQLLDGDGRPIGDGMIEAWDAAGGRWGRSGTDADGRFSFVAAKPPRARAGAAPRLDIYVFARGLLKHQLTRMYFPDEPEANASDPVLSSLAGGRSCGPRRGAGRWGRCASTFGCRASGRRSSSRCEPVLGDLRAGRAGRRGLGPCVARRDARRRARPGARGSGRRASCPTTKRRRSSRRPATRRSTTSPGWPSRGARPGIPSSPLVRRDPRAGRRGARRRGAPRRDEPGHPRLRRDARRQAGASTSSTPSFAGAAGECARLAAEHRHTVMAARTLLQQAVPTTFGYKAAGWLVGLHETRVRLAAVAASLPAQLGGAAGTLAALGADGTEVLRLYAAELGLREPTFPGTRIGRRSPSSPARSPLPRARPRRSQATSCCSPRPRWQRWPSATAAGRRRCRTSATPSSAALAVACARHARANAALLLESVVQEHERAAGAWHAEWHALDTALAATGGAARRYGGRSPGWRSTSRECARTSRPRRSPRRTRLGIDAREPDDYLGSVDAFVDRALALYRAMSTVVLCGSLGSSPRSWDRAAAGARGHRVVRDRPPGARRRARRLTRGRRRAREPRARRRPARPVLLRRPVARRRGRDADRAHRRPSGSTGSCSRPRPPASASRSSGSSEPLLCGPTAWRRSWTPCSPAGSRPRSGTSPPYRAMMLAVDPEGYARCCEALARWDVRETLAGVSRADARDRRRRRPVDAARRCCRRSRIGSPARGSR